MAFSLDPALLWPRTLRAHSRSLMTKGKVFSVASKINSDLIYFHSRSCPVDNSIFPGFTTDGNALQSIYEAFRFTESYGVIFQCNVKYCLGPCEPAVCEWGRDSMESWGRKRRSVRNETSESDDDMNISQEILVLDFGDEHNRDFLRSDPSTDFGRGNSFNPVSNLKGSLKISNFRQNSDHH